MEKRVLVCGDRNWCNRNVIKRELQKLPHDTVIIHGAASGADSIAGDVARELGMSVIEFPAEWHKYGRAAGPLRNKRMLDEGRPDIVLAFHPDIESSKGMVGQARRAHLPVSIYSQ